MDSETFSPLANSKKKLDCVVKVFTVWSALRSYVRRGLLTSGLVFVHNNARPQTARKTFGKVHFCIFTPFYFKEVT